MPTVAELLDWRPDQLAALADDLFASRRTLKGLQEEINTGKPPESWDAPAAPSARIDYEDLDQRLNDIAAQVSDLAVTLDETVAEIRAARSTLQDALTEASAEGFSVNRQIGEVTAPEIPAASFPGDPRAQNAENLRVQREADAQDKKVETIAHKIERALERAEFADVGLAVAMESTISYSVRGGDGSIDEAIKSQLPPSLDKMSPAEIAEILGGEIATETISAYLEAKIPVYKGIFADVGIKADYRVMLDGRVVMNLHAEGGLGAMLGQPGKNASVSSGATADLGITFDSKEEAERFLRGLEDASKDVNIVAGKPVINGIAAYINNENVTSRKIGLYGQGEFEFDTRYAKADGNGRIEGYYDEEQDEYGIKIEGSFKGSAHGSADTGIGGSASVGLAGEAKTDGDGRLKEVSFSGAVSGGIMNEKLGREIPGISSGANVDVELKMKPDNIMWHEMNEAMRSGDVDRATDIAMDHGQVVIRHTKITDGSVDFGAGEAGTDATSTTSAWVRDANSRELVHVDPDTDAQPAADPSVTGSDRK